MAKVLFNIAYTSKNPPRNLKPQQKAEYLARRSFYNLSADYNYFSYSLNGEKVVKNKDAFGYFFNKGNEQPTEITGAFNLKGEISKEELEKLTSKLKKTDSIIWHGVISFDDEISQGFTTQEKAVRFLNQSFNAFLERSHLNKNNIELVASLHKDTDNAHIHFSFFEKEPMHRNCRGERCYTQKGTINSSVLENYLISANMHLSEHSYDYYTARERSMNRLKQLRANAADNKFSSKELKQAVLRLAAKLPKESQLQYNRENLAPYRKEIDDVAQLLIRSDPAAAEADRAFRAALAAKELEGYEIVHAPVTKHLDKGDKQLKYVNNRELNSAQVQKLLREGKTEYIRASNIKWENIDYFEKLRQDYAARVGNQVLGLIKDMKHNFTNKTRPGNYNDKRKKIEARIRRRTHSRVLGGFLGMLGNYQRGITADFTHRLHEVEREIELQKQAESEVV